MQRDLPFGAARARRGPTLPSRATRVSPGAVNSNRSILACPRSSESRAYRVRQVLLTQARCCRSSGRDRRERRIAEIDHSRKRLLKSCPFAERMKLSASSRRPSSFSETRGSAIWMLPCPVIRRLAPPSPPRARRDRATIDAVVGLEARFRCAIGIGMPAAATWAGGPNRTLAFPATLSAAIVTRRERDLGVDVEARMIVAAARELDLNALVGRQLARDEPERHTRRAALDAPRTDQLLALDRDVLGVKLIGPAGARHLGRDEQLGDLEVLRSPIRDPARRQSADPAGRRQLPSGETDTLMSARPIRVSGKRTSPRRSGVRASSAQTRSAVERWRIRLFCHRAAADRAGCAGSAGAGSR